MVSPTTRSVLRVQVDAVLTQVDANERDFVHRDGLPRQLRQQALGTVRLLLNASPAEGTTDHAGNNCRSLWREAC